MSLEADNAPSIHRTRTVSWRRPNFARSEPQVLPAQSAGVSRR